MSKLKSASEIKKISEDNLKIREQQNKEIREKDELQEYEVCIHKIDTSALRGETSTDCEPLAEKYQKLLKQNEYKLSIEKKDHYNSMSHNIEKRDVLRVSWK